ncbi:large conductance mechanosensitive channel protein MscL [Actinomyces provencensis]|uniref:large conductance mechanosensitive channel protein MscL n=1 Tax=Actinomyces provencensis TaxID=1720198 RepID=UPI00096ABD15|nr:large conductance mechanosensitive channel protein MscL [Actinomyces provencensis]
MIQGFKDFISRGSVIDLAVGVIIGGAFTAVIDAVVDKFINPLIGGIFGKPNFDSLLQFTIGTGDNAALVQPGAILTALVNFLLVAIALYFFIVVPMNKLAAMNKTKVEEAEPEQTEETKLLVEIRDLLAREIPTTK